MVNLHKQGIRDCAAQMLFDGVAKQTSAGPRMKTTLNEKRNHRFIGNQVETLPAKNGEFPADVERAISICTS